jgi:hypothetical protein
MWHSLLKRDDQKCVNNDEVDTCAKYASVFLTTGVPLIIGLRYGPSPSPAPAPTLLRLLSTWS